MRIPAETSAPAYNYNEQVDVNQNQAFALNHSTQTSNQPNQSYYDPYSNPAPQCGQQPPQSQQPPNAGPNIFNPNASIQIHFLANFQCLTFK